ncbi:DUF192 domain-containing protein [Salipaludibacillus daqingensis]|uniref:DUF192 domain-containing protein n=1 Tax=Salipaludibacillus daqingensis TaxID=3041001 RepID=UPI0024762431|nr:DUF192 domain-containing protein [Salipaludibacillus daqingensis]
MIENTKLAKVSRLELGTVKKADTFATRLKGLMFRRKPIENEALWIKPCNSIHTCFMNFPIDVLFLDKNERIVHMIENLKPWRFVPPVAHSKSVLELPKGTIQQEGLQKGEKLEL